MNDTRKKIDNTNISFKIIFFITIFFVAIIYFFPKIGFIILLIVLTDFIIYRILSKSCDKKKSDSQLTILPQKELERSSSLLRYATAVLSFISLTTTANGFSTFVFAKNQSWLAYLASFAVQSFLVVFSLLLCHFYSSIKEIESLSERGKTLLLITLISFGAVSLIVSSAFSFSYIANNAYSDSWTEDSDVIIENYLIRETNSLQNENEQIGKQLLNNIQGTLEDGLKESIEEYEKEKSEEVLKELKNNPLDKYENIKKKEIQIPENVKNSWKARYPNSAVEIDGLVEDFNKNLGDLSNYIKDYNKITKEYNKFDFTSDSVSNWDEKYNEIESLDNKINQMQKELQLLKKSCNNLKISVVNNDLVPYRNRIVRKIEQFLSFVKNQEKNLKDLCDKINNAMNGFAVDEKTKSIPEQIETIQKKIYLLQGNDILDTGTDTGTTDPDNSNNVEEIRTDIANLLLEFSGSDALQDKDIKQLMQLKDDLNEYNKYNKLAASIEEFSSNNLRKTYFIIKSTTDILKNEDETDETNEDDEIDEESIENENFEKVTIDAWKENRDNDFHEFFSLLKMLPDQTSTITTSIAAINNNFFTELLNSKNNAKDKYDPATVLKKANKIRRDLLGQITDFERAINYFFYDFKMMAIFSAFIAIFFDLGAFLTGCFLYGTKHLKTEDETETESKETGG